MFTGIVEQRGRVARLAKRGGGARLEVRAPEIVEDLKLGDSVSVNGACVTVTERDQVSFACDLVPETVARTTLGILQVDEAVNLERPMKMSDRFGGHLVQGHVDAVGVVRSRRKVGAQEVLEITIPFELSRFLAPQGSVALDGVSLTVVAVEKDRFRVALIPYTVEMTTLGEKVQGSSVNVEIDVLSKYVERHLATRMPRPAYLAPVRKAEDSDPESRVTRPEQQLVKKSIPKRATSRRSSAKPATPTASAPKAATKTAKKPVKKPVKKVAKKPVQKVAKKAAASKKPRAGASKKRTSTRRS